MWFKNLISYRLPTDWSMSAAELEDMLQQRGLVPCGAFDMQSRGWVHSSYAERFVHTVNGQHLIALGVDQKLLPGSVVNQVAAERAKVMADEQGYPVGRRQMRELKARVTEELRGRALTRKRITFAWIDPANGWLVVDAAGESRADELIETLRDTLGSLQVTRLESERSPITSMTAWVAHGDAPLGFTIDDDLQLQSPQRSTPLIRYKSCELDAKEIRSQLQAGWQVTHLGLTWKDRIALVLNGKLQVKRVEFLELVKEAPAEGERSVAEQFDADFLVMTGELTAMLAQLVQVLGSGLARSDDDLAVAGRMFADTVEDPLFDAAVQFARESPVVTISRLQSNLMIGYNRAARLIERMEAEHLVGPMQPDGSRVNYLSTDSTQAHASGTVEA